MAGQFTYTGDTAVLTNLLITTAVPTAPTLQLFSAPTSIAKGDALATFTVFTTGVVTGYDASHVYWNMTATATSWPTTAQSGNTVTWTGVQYTFTFLTTATTVTAMGYISYVGSAVYWNELFNGTSGFTIPLGGGTVKVTPSVSAA